MSYENENEIVLTNELFTSWCDEINGNKASMECGDTAKFEKPCYYLNEATGTKTQLKKYRFEFDPDELATEENPTAKVTSARAIWTAIDGHEIISYAPVKAAKGVPVK